MYSREEWGDIFALVLPAEATMDLSFLLMFVDTSKVGGWTRAAVGAGLAAAIAKWPLLKEYLDPATQAAVATAASGIAIGIWSHVAKAIQANQTPNRPVQTGGMPARAGLVLFALFGASLVMASQVRAADILTKAAPTTPGYPYASSGFYFGVGTSATAAQADIANTNLTAAGAGLDLVLGYQFRGGLDFIAPEVDFTYTNIGNSGACTQGATVTNCSTNNAWEIEPLVKFGFPVTTITGLLPNLSTYFPALPQLPSGVTGAEHPYLYGGMPIRDVSANYGLVTGSEWTIQPEIGAGILSQWTNGLAIDVRAGCSIGNAGFELGAAGHGSVGLGTACTSRLEALY
jgi:hypothetical protein